MTQSFAQIFLHIVFAAKERRALIHPSIHEDLYAYLGGICRRLKSETLQVGGTENHVHILCTLPRSLCPGDLLEHLKKSSSRWLRLKDRRFNWQNGYGVFSIGASGVAALRRYIQEQEKHHRRRTFEEEFQELLQRYGVEFDLKGFLD
jgi:REP element-mobilizing transposase RayT